ncbi:putative ribonuclease H-like domain-containing protein, partial [Tanacetum coccineum]
NTPNIAGSGPNWLFDINALTKLMNYKPVVARNQSNGNAGTKACDDVGKARMKTVPGKDYSMLPMWPADLPFSQNSKSSPNAGFNPLGDNEKKVTKEQEKKVADKNNLNTFMPVSPIPTARIHKDNPIEQIILYLNSAPQTRRMKKNLEEHGLFSLVQQRTTMKTFKIAYLLAFYHKKDPERNKKDERGIVIKNKARLVAQGYTQEEGIDYDEVFVPISRNEAIRLFLPYASFKDIVVYQIDVKSAFLYGKIEEEVYVCQPPGFEDPDFPHRTMGFREETYTRLCLSEGTKFEKMMHKKCQMSSMGELTFFLGLQVKQKEDGIFICQDKYVTKILKKFGFTDVKTESTPMETQKALLKDEDGEEVDVYLYRSMIGSLMYLTSSRPDIIDYAGASLDRKSTTGGCQFLGCRLISWQCNKQNVVANSTTEVEYVAASSCCGQVL